MPPDPSIVSRAATILAEKQALRQLVCHVEDPSAGVSYKPGNSPLTLTDLAVDDRLFAVVSRHFPEDGWISEERPERMVPSRSGLTWVVDPIDGTREFLEGTPHFSMSVALFDERACEVRFGVVYNFMRDELFYALDDEEGVRFEGDKKQLSYYDKNVILISRTEARMGLFVRWQGLLPFAQIGSIAYKLGLLSANCGKAVVSLKHKNIWDILAGCFLASKAGFNVCSVDGTDLKFSTEKTEYPTLLVSKEPFLSELLSILRHAS
jgi:myo-inositol-1(or 4)-monophosphatase